MNSEIRTSLPNMEAEAEFWTREIELNGTRVYSRSPIPVLGAEVGKISGVFGEGDGSVEVLGC